jgi:hypothetical protein
MECDGRGHHPIEDAFGDRLAIGVQDGIDGHQVANIAHQHETATWKSQRAAVRRGEGAVRVERALNRAPAFLKACREIAAH